ncbi:hypothetical protein VTN00DRAFT_6511 [Thermoascus crustaceus]|uniref:uncharacterized protein n=1 Tax=Thermoascus crustaceus TaxID=5088 RepID=UPI003743B02B
MCTLSISPMTCSQPSPPKLCGDDMEKGRGDGDKKRRSQVGETETASRVLKKKYGEIDTEAPNVDRYTSRRPRQTKPPSK